MSYVVDNMDVTAQLPDEVLCHVFSFMSLADKLRSEAVSRRFQRCILEQFKSNPQPLDVNFRHLKLNGYNVPLEQICGAVETLAKKAMFSAIWVHNSSWDILTRMEQMEQILSLLTSEHQCLSKVTDVRIHSGCSQAAMEQFIDKCVKLSSIQFEYMFVIPLNNEPSGSNYFPMDLGPLFKNKPLTEIKLTTCRYHQESLIEMLQSIKPNTLRKLDLRLDDTPALNIAKFVKGSALEEIRFKIGSVEMQLTELFESLAGLPRLRKCEIDCFLNPPNQFVSAVTSLFSKSHLNIAVNTGCKSLFTDLHGCQIVNMFHQVRNVHPGLVIDYDFRGHLVLSLGHARLELGGFATAIEHCPEEDCVQCQSFYPCVLNFLRSRAADAAFHFDERQNFPNWHLDRCRVEQIMRDLNMTDFYCGDLFWRALSVDQAGQSICVNFEFEMREGGNGHFSVTISCGDCLIVGCMKCVN